MGSKLRGLVTFQFGIIWSIVWQARSWNRNRYVLVEIHHGWYTSILGGGSLLNWTHSRSFASLRFQIQDFVCSVEQVRSSYLLSPLPISILLKLKAYCNPILLEASSGAINTRYLPRSQSLVMPLWTAAVLYRTNYKMQSKRDGRWYAKWMRRRLSEGVRCGLLEISKYR